MQSLKFYLLAAPNAPDARDVRNMIYKIEAQSEVSLSMAKKETDENKSALDSLVGIWRYPDSSNSAYSNGGYSNIAHYRAEKVGSDLLFITVYENPLSSARKRGILPGHEKPKYIIKESGGNFTCRPAEYDSSLVSQEIGIEVSNDYKKITFIEWCSDVSPSKLTFTYHKCQNESPSSCGW